MVSVRPELLVDIVRSTSLKFRLRGTSMLPTVWPGAQIRVSAPVSSFRVGDLVFFMQYERLVLHRVIAVEPARLLTQGDNRLQNDGWIEQEKIIGVVRGLVLFRWHLGFIPRWLCSVVKKTYLPMLPAVRRLFWLGCKVSKPVRRALTSEYTPHSLRT